MLVGVRESGCLLLSSLPKVGTFPPNLLPYALPTSISTIRRRIRRRPFSTHVVSKLRSPDVIDLEYADLNLKEKIVETVGHVRIRQHVNPLSSSMLVPVEVPNWKEIFDSCTLPLMVDVGSGQQGYGSYRSRLDSHLGYCNRVMIVDLELSRYWQLAERACLWVKDLGLKNIHFMFANAMVSFEQLVSIYPGPLTLVSILCPDPHFKKRHQKRRVVQKPLVDSILKNLTSGGQVFVQSDVLDVALDMRNQFDARPDVLQHIDDLDSNVLCDSQGWLLSNPMGIRTEREIHAELEGAKIYRRLYQKMT